MSDLTSDVLLKLQNSRILEHNTNCFPHLSVVAAKAKWMPVVSVDVERSFSQYKHILNDRRESLSTANTKKLTMMYTNGDIMKRLD